MSVAAGWCGGRLGTLLVVMVKVQELLSVSARVTKVWSLELERCCSSIIQMQGCSVEFDEAHEGASSWSGKLSSFLSHQSMSKECSNCFNLHASILQRVLLVQLEECSSCFKNSNHALKREIV
ncbi:hypothetical protein ACSQ67_024089 [Phaseolus vulgaris]